MKPIEEKPEALRTNIIQTLYSVGKKTETAEGIEVQYLFEEQADAILKILREELNPSPLSADMERRAKLFWYEHEVSKNCVVSLGGEFTPLDTFNANMIIDFARQFAKQELTSQRWIPVAERLPETTGVIKHIVSFY